jgi:hypothetical protein
LASLALATSTEALGRKTTSSLMRVLDLRECERLARELHELRSKIEAHLRSRQARRIADET